jgi:hypothetical protein
MSDLLDVHTTLGGGDEDGRLRCSVSEDGDVVLLLGRGSLGEHDGVADSAGLAGLLGDELLAEHLGRELLGLSGTGKGRSKGRKEGRRLGRKVHQDIRSASTLSVDQFTRWISSNWTMKEDQEHFSAEAFLLRYLESRIVDLYEIAPPV